MKKLATTAIAMLALTASGGLLTMTPARAAASATEPTATAPDMASTGAAPAAEASKLSPTLIRDAQETLDGDGIHVRIDGRWGPQTEAAVKRYQKQDGLSVSGELDQATLDQMHLAR